MQDSNLRNARIKTWCLTTWRIPFNGVSEGIRTPDTRLRRPVLYPTELQTQLERKTGFEPATLALARRCSTTEPLPHMVRLEGLEPPRARRQILSLVRLPIPPQPHIIIC